MARRKLSLPPDFLRGAVLCGLLYLLWLAVGAYLIDSAAVGEEAAREIALSGAVVCAFAAVFIDGGNTVWKNCGVGMIVWAVLQAVGIVSFGPPEPPDAVVLLVLFVLGAAAGTYGKRRCARGGKRRKKRRAGK